MMMMMMMIIIIIIIIIISASLYERSAYATGILPGPSVGPHMRAVATHVDVLSRRLGW